MGSQQDINRAIAEGITISDKAREQRRGGLADGEGRISYEEMLDNTLKSAEEDYAYNATLDPMQRVAIGLRARDNQRAAREQRLGTVKAVVYNPVTGQNEVQL